MTQCLCLTSLIYLVFLKTFFRTKNFSTITHFKLSFIIFYNLKPTPWTYTLFTFMSILRETKFIAIYFFTNTRISCFIENGFFAIFTAKKAILISLILLIDKIRLWFRCLLFIPIFKNDNCLIWNILFFKSIFFKVDNWGDSFKNFLYQLFIKVFFDYFINEESI